MRQPRSHKFRMFLSLIIVLITWTLGAEGSAVTLQMVDVDDAGTLPTSFAQSPVTLEEQMQQALVDGNVEQAGVLATALLKSHPENGNGHALKSLYLALHGQRVQARDHLQQARQHKADSFYLDSVDAVMLHNEKKHSEAKKRCRQAIAKAPIHPYPWSILGKIYFDQKEYAQAMECYRKCIELNKNFTVAYINAGTIAFAMGQMNEAVILFKEAIVKNKASFAAFWGLANVYESLGQKALALESLKRCMELQPANSMALEMAGKLFLQTGQYDQAIELGKKLEPFEKVNAYLLLGNAYLHKGSLAEALRYVAIVAPLTDEGAYLQAYCLMADGQYEPALEVVEKLSKKNPRHFGAQYTRSVVRLYLGMAGDDSPSSVDSLTVAQQHLLRFSSGCQALSQHHFDAAYQAFADSGQKAAGFALFGIDEGQFASVVSPQEAKYVDLAVLYLSEQLYSLSLQQLKKAADVNKQSLLARYLSAQVFLRKGDRSQAKQYMQNSIKIMPSFFSALYALGEINFSEGNFDAAAEYYQQAARVHDDAGVLIRLGLYFEHIGNVGAAVAQYKKVVAIAPEYYVGYNQLAWLYAKKGLELDTAMLLAQKANTLQPGNASVLDTIGWILFQKKQYADSVPYFEKALRISSNSPTFHYHLGSVFLAMGKEEAGREEFKRALSLSSNFEEADEVKKLLDASSKK